MSDRLRAGVEAGLRRPALAVFAVGLVVRAIVAVAVAIKTGGTLFVDDGTYSRLALERSLGRSIDPTLWRFTTPIILPLSWIYEVLGEVKLAGQLYVALLGAGVAAVTARLALEVLPLRWAAAAGLAVALFPSQVLFSSVILKDAAVWLSLSGLALVVAVAARARGWRLAALAPVAVLILLWLGHLRFLTLVIACWALVPAMLLGRRNQRLAQVAAAVAIAVCVPWIAFDLGPAGADFVEQSHNEGGLLRAKGKAATEGRFVLAPTAYESGLDADVGALPEGLSATLVEPTPLQATGGTALRLAGFETIVWYPMLALAAFGLVSLRRRHLAAMTFPLLTGAGVILAWALLHGNLGTTYRHRGEAVWVIVLLAAIGAERLWLRRRRDAPADPPDGAAA